MRSEAITVDEYLAALPENRRESLARVRRVILDHLPTGYEEAMNWGMITYQLPLAVYPDTYNGQPLMVAALASILREDAVQESDRWAQAIVRYAPSCEVTYIALVAAQIRRESNFHARDLEWLYDGVIPDVAHELGVDDHVRTLRAQV